MFYKVDKDLKIFRGNHLNIRVDAAANYFTRVEIGVREQRTFASLAWARAFWERPELTILLHIAEILTQLPLLSSVWEI